MTVLKNSVSDKTKRYGIERSHDSFNVYGYIWMYMDVYGCIWMYMDVYGCIWKDIGV
jgi:hypothetical protein